MEAHNAINLIIQFPVEFALGFEEAGQSFGMTFDDDPDSDRSAAYDLGRTLGEAYL